MKILPPSPFHILQKPAEMSACNGCGYCCHEEACKLARKYIWTDSAPCVALEYQDGRFWCGLLRNPAKYLPNGLKLTAEDCGIISSNFAFRLAVGFGCDSVDPE